MWNDKLHNSSKLVHGKRIKYCLLARGYCMMMWASVLEATNCHGSPKIMPPKSLDGDSVRAPWVSRASDGKGPFDQYGKYVIS